MVQKAHVWSCEACLIISSRISFGWESISIQFRSGFANRVGKSDIFFFESTLSSMRVMFRYATIAEKVRERAPEMGLLESDMVNPNFAPLLPI